MASHNRLLGYTHDPEPAPFGHDLPPNVRAPMFMYHDSCPQGKVVKLDAEVARLEREGWVDHPAKVRRLPGWEKFYDDYQTSLKPKDQENANGEEVQTETETLTPSTTGETDTGATSSPEGRPVSPPPEPTEDEIRANKLKEESDRVEKARLEGIEKQDKRQEQCVCDVCGKGFDSPRACRMHKMGAHRQKG